MKKRNVVLIILTFVFVLPNYSQGVGLEDPNFLQNMRTKDLREDAETLGSPYVNKTFSPIKIKNIKGNVLYSGRFNAYNGEMEVKLSEDKVIALNMSNSLDYHVEFVNENKNYKTYNYIDKDGKEKRGFLVELSDADGIGLLKKEKIKYYKGEKATTSYDKDKPAKFKKERDIYLAKLNDDVKYISTKKKDLLKAFPEQSKELSSYIKKNKLKLTKEEDLIKVVEYLGTL